MVGANSERIDRLIEEGYRLLREDKKAEACDVWLEAWETLKATLDTEEEGFFYNYYIMEWLVTLDMCLGGLGVSDQTYYHKRLQFLEDILEEFKFKNFHFKRSEAETYYRVGEVEECIRRFEELLKEHPDHFWGYISYGDILYKVGDERAEEVYTKALEVSTEEEMDVIYERFGWLFEDAEEKVSEIIQKNTPEILESYKAYRKMLKDLYQRAMDKVDRNMIFDCARMFGVVEGGELAFNDEYEDSAFSDFFLSEYRAEREGKSMIERYGGAKDNVEAEMVKALTSSYTSLFRIVSTSWLRGEVELEDVLNGGKVSVTNINLSKTADQGALYFTRIIPLEQLNINQGGFLFDNKLKAK